MLYLTAVSMCLCSHLTGPNKHHSDLMRVIRRHLVQNLHSAVNHLPQRINTVKKKKILKTTHWSRSQVSLGDQQT